MLRELAKRVYTRWVAAVDDPLSEEERRWIALRYDKMRHWGWRSSDVDTKWESPLGTIWVEKIGTGKRPWVVRGEARAAGRRYTTSWLAWAAAIELRAWSDRNY